MRKILSLISLGLVIVSITTNAQDKNAGGFRVLTSPIQFIFSDYSLSLEKIHHRFTFGVTGSYKFSTKNSGEVKPLPFILNSYTYQNMNNDMYNAYMFGVNSKWYLKERFPLFLEAALFYRHWWFDNKYVSYSGGYPSFSGLRSEWQDVYGMKFLVGYTFDILKEKRTHPVIDIYAGINIRKTKYVFKTYNGVVEQAYFPYQEDRRNEFKPPVDLGIKVGIVHKSK